MRSAMRLTSGSRCEMYTTAAPEARISAMRSNSRSLSAPVNDSVGSSRMSDLGIQRERPGDLQQLVLGDAQLADPDRGLDARPDHGQTLAGPVGGLGHARPTSHGHRQHQVLGDRQVLQDRRVLIHHRETQGLGRCR